MTDYAFECFAAHVHQMWREKPVSRLDVTAELVGDFWVVETGMDLGRPFLDLDPAETDAELRRRIKEYRNWNPDNFTIRVNRMQPPIYHTRAGARCYLGWLPDCWCAVVEIHEACVRCEIEAWLED